jgi:hypothetical protein
MVAARCRGALPVPAKFTVNVRALLAPPPVKPLPATRVVVLSERDLTINLLKKTRRRETTRYHPVRPPLRAIDDEQ